MDVDGAVCGTARRLEDVAGAFAAFYLAQFTAARAHANLAHEVNARYVAAVLARA